MAMLPHTIDIILEFEPIVKIVCEAFDCQYNLVNTANLPDRKMAACNLKQITIGNNATCLNYKSLRSVSDED